MKHSHELTKSITDLVNSCHLVDYYFMTPKLYFLSLRTKAPSWGHNFFQ